MNVFKIIIACCFFIFTIEAIQTTNETSLQVECHGLSEKLRNNTEIREFISLFHLITRKYIFQPTLRSSIAVNIPI